MSLIDPNFSVNMAAQSIYLDGITVQFHPIEWKNFVDRLPEQIHSEYDRLHCWYDFDNRAEVEKFRWNPVTEKLEHYNVPKEIWTVELRDFMKNLCREFFDAEKERIFQQEETLKRQLNQMAAEASPSAIHTNGNETSLGSDPVYGGITITQDDEFRLYAYLQDFVKYQLKETDYVFNPDVGLQTYQQNWYSAVRSFWRKANYLIDKENIIPFCASVERPNHPNDPLLVIPTSISCKLHTKTLCLYFKIAYPKIWEAFEKKDLNRIADLTNVWCKMAVEYNRQELAWAYFPQLEFLIYSDLLHKEIYRRDALMSKEEMLEFFEQNKDACLQKVKDANLLTVMPIYEDLISITPVEGIKEKVRDYLRWVHGILADHLGQNSAAPEEI
jgi:hypothetical protein